MGIGTAEVRLYTVINDKSLILGTGGSEKALFVNRTLLVQLSEGFYFEERPSKNLTSEDVMTNTFTLNCST